MPLSSSLIAHVIAHRGVRNEFPENTIASLQEAVGPPRLALIPSVRNPGETMSVIFRP